MEKTLRDELAMGMNYKSIPSLNNMETIMYVIDKFGMDIDMDDPLWQVNFALKYEAIIRYMYADEMLKVRG